LWLAVSVAQIRSFFGDAPTCSEHCGRSLVTAPVSFLYASAVSFLPSFFPPLLSHPLCPCPPSPPPVLLDFLPPLHSLNPTFIAATASVTPSDFQWTWRSATPCPPRHRPMLPARPWRALLVRVPWAAWPPPAVRNHWQQGCRRPLCAGSLPPLAASVGEGVTAGGGDAAVGPLAWRLEWHQCRRRRPCHRARGGGSGRRRRRPGAVGAPTLPLRAPQWRCSVRRRAASAGAAWGGPPRSGGGGRRFGAARWCRVSRRLTAAVVGERRHKVAGAVARRQPPTAVTGGARLRGWGSACLHVGNGKHRRPPQCPRRRPCVVGGRLRVGEVASVCWVRWPLFFLCCLSDAVPPPLVDGAPAGVGTGWGARVGRARHRHASRRLLGGAPRLSTSPRRPYRRRHATLC